LPHANIDILKDGIGPILSSQDTLHDAIEFHRACPIEKLKGSAVALGHAHKRGCKILPRVRHPRNAYLRNAYP
jgi:hypothetical protein